MKKFKKFILSCLCILFFSFSNEVFAATGIVTGKTVRIRESADSNSDIVTNAYRNDEVTVLDEEGEWYHVKYEGKTGYISKEYVEVKEYVGTSESNSSSNNKDNTQEASNQTLATPTISKDASLKLLPNFSSRNLGLIQVGTEIEVKGEVNNWLQITAGSNTGWILKNNVSGYSINNTLAKPDNSTGDQENTSDTENKSDENAVADSTVNSETQTNGDYQKQTGYINTDTVRVRETAGGKIIGNIDINDVVTIIGEEGDWYQITCDEYQNGYVSKSLVTIGKVPSRSLTEERGAEEPHVIEDTVEETTQAEEQQTQQPDIEIVIPAPVQEVQTSEPENQETIVSEPVANSSLGDEIAEYAKTYLGCPYVSGGTSPSGFDCSGFTQYVYSHFGYGISRVASTQASEGVEVSRENLQPGDLLIFQDSGRTSIGHVAIYIGEGNFVHAANPSRGVVIDNLNTNSYYNIRFVTARRID